MKIVKYVLILAAVAFLAYNSVYFKSLRSLRSESAKQFEPGAYARKFLDNDLPPALAKAVDIKDLLQLLRTTPDSAFNAWSHSLAVGNIRYFLVKGEGDVTAVNDDDVRLQISQGAGDIRINTGFIYGNAIRDASGLVSNTAFSNTADFNSISAEINRMIRKERIPTFRAAVVNGALVAFTGALQLNRQHLDTAKLELVPITLKIITNQ